MATASADLSIRQGDTAPAVTVAVTGADGLALDLTGTTCRFLMRELNATTPAVDAAMTLTHPATGVATYTWAAGDTDVAGIYMAEVRVALIDGTFYTYPNDGYLTIAVEENLTNPNLTIVSLGDAKDILQIPPDDHTQDAKIVRFVRGVQLIIEGQIGPVVRRTFDEWYDGGSSTIKLRRRPTTALGSTPVLNLMACSEYVGPIEWPLAVVASPDKGQTYSCMLDPSTGTVVRRTVGGGVQAFPPGPQTVHVIYEAGQAAVPWNVYEGTLEILREHYQQTQQVGLGESLLADESTESSAIIGFLVSGKVRQWLSPMRRHPSVA